MTPSERQKIVRLHVEKKKLREIVDDLGLSITASRQALKHVTSTGSTQNKIRAQRPLKTTPRTDRMIHRISKTDRHNAK